MRDPLNPGIVRPTDNFDVAPQTKDDPRPLWKRLLTSLRPTASVGKDMRTGKLNETVEVKGHIDF